MSKADVKVQVTRNLENLTEQQLEMVNQYISFMRTLADDKAMITEFNQIWERWKSNEEPMSDEEVAEIAEEAVAWARGEL